MVLGGGGGGEDGGKIEKGSEGVDGGERGRVYRRCK